MIGTVAPAIGAAIGGPLGGAVVSILAEVFGVGHSEAEVAAAIETNSPETVAAKLAAAEAKFKAAAEEAVTLRGQIDAHVELVRLDMQRGWYWSLWRPAAGWIATLFAAACCFIVIKDAWGGQYGFLNLAPSVLMIGGPIMALAGVYAWQKSEERKTLMTSGLGSAVDAIRKAIAR